LDGLRRRAITDFYREEFQRHLLHLQESGLFAGDGCTAALDKACQRLVDDLDRVCCRDEFPVLAETLLQSFETLTRLSEIEPRQGH
jgi:hypothetical protein